MAKCYFCGKKDAKEKWYPFCSQKCAANMAVCDFKTTATDGLHWCSLTKEWEYSYEEDCGCSKELT